MSATFYGYLRWIEAGAAFNPWLWLIGSSLAYSLLLRPEQVLFSVAILPAMWWVQRRSHRSLAPIAVCAALVMLPLVAWTARNWRTFHVLQPLAPRYANDPGETPPLGFARWYRTWAVEFSSTDEVYWNYNSGPIDPAMLPERAFDSATSSETEHIRQRTLGVLHQYNQTGLQSTESEAGFRALAEQRVQAHPTRYYILLPLGRLADMILRPRTEMMAVPLEWWRWREHPQITLRAAAYAALNFLYLGVGAAGFWKWRRSGFSPSRHWSGLCWQRCCCVARFCSQSTTPNPGTHSSSFPSSSLALVRSSQGATPTRHHPPRNRSLDCLTQSGRLRATGPRSVTSDCLDAGSNIRAHCVSG